MSHFILVNKPVGWTSFDVVNFLKKKIKSERPEHKNIKIGHAGTLDPFATGLLIVGIGREATRELDTFKALKKTYRATILLGATSDTQDVTGTITSTQQPFTTPTVDMVKETLQHFVGEQNQLPPMHSAKKVGGVRLYKLARQGKTVERTASTITIFSITLIDYIYPRLTIEVTCSAGTYIRTLAADIGAQLGAGGYCETLERTAIGNHTLANAQDPETAGQEALRFLDKTT